MRLAAPQEHDHLQVLDDVLVLSEQRAHSLQGDVAQVYLAVIADLSVPEIAERLAARNELRRSATTMTWIEDVTDDLMAAGFLVEHADGGESSTRSERLSGRDTSAVRAFANWELPQHLDRLLMSSARRAHDPAVAQGLVAHGVDALAAAAAFRSGVPVSPALRRGAWETALHALITRRLIISLTALLDQPVVLLRGAELAANHVHPGLRRQGDLDILVSDMDDAVERLRSAGWSAAFDDAHCLDTHHTALLRAPDWPIELDLHRRVSWPTWMTAPTTRELLERTEASATGLSAVRALSPEDQILHVAAHSYGHRPFWQLRDLIDLALLFERADLDVVTSRALEWGVERLWAITEATVRSHVLGDGSSQPIPFRVLGRHVRSLEDSPLARGFAEKSIGRFAVTDPRTAVRTIRDDAMAQFNDQRQDLRLRSLVSRLADLSRNDVGSPSLHAIEFNDPSVVPIRSAGRTRKRAGASADPSP